MEKGTERRRDRPRIADVAREAGVSKTAVSFAFNSPERLSAETAVRIREVADGLGYRPNPVARLLTQLESPDLVMFSTDYPHWHDDVTGLLPPEALPAIMADNARTFYRL